jgi:hypothetical protein
MWVFDSYYKGCVELWSRERGLKRSALPINPGAILDKIEGYLAPRIDLSTNPSPD